MRALVFLCIVSSAVAYILNYDLDNHEREEEGIPGVAVKGEYSFDAPNGDSYKFYYVADKYGYRIVETDVDTDVLSDAEETAFKNAVEGGDGVVVGLQDGADGGDAGGDGEEGGDEGGDGGDGEEGEDEDGGDGDEGGDEDGGDGDEGEDEDGGDGEEGGDKDSGDEGDSQKRSIKYSDDDDDKRK